MNTTRITSTSSTLLAEEGTGYMDIDIHLGEGAVIGLDGQPAIDLAIRILSRLVSREPSSAVADEQLTDAAAVIQREIHCRALRAGQTHGPNSQAGLQAVVGGAR